MDNTCSFSAIKTFPQNKVRGILRLPETRISEVYKLRAWIVENVFWDQGEPFYVVTLAGECVYFKILLKQEIDLRSQAGFSDWEGLNVKWVLFTTDTTRSLVQ